MSDLINDSSTGDETVSVSSLEFGSVIDLGYQLGTLKDEETSVAVPADKLNFILNGVPANEEYTVEVRAYRSVDKDIDPTGLIKSAPGYVPASPFVPSKTVVLGDGVLVGGTPIKGVVDAVINPVTGRPINIDALATQLEAEIASARLEGTTARLDLASSVTALNLDVAAAKLEGTNAMAEAAQVRADLVPTITQAKTEATTARAEATLVRTDLVPTITAAKQAGLDASAQVALVRSDLVPTIAQAKQEGTTARTEAAQVKTDLSTEVQRAKDDTAAIRTVTTQLQTDVSGNSSAISAETTTRASADSALSNRVDTVTATANTDRSTINARIQTEETARADAVSAVAGRTSFLETKYSDGSTGNLALSTKITDEATARSTADDALANRTSKLESNVNSGDNSLVKLRGSITDNATTSANATAAVAARAGALETTVNDSVNGNLALKSKIASEETSRSSADATLANRTSTLESAVNTGSNSLNALRGSITDNATTAATATTAVANRTTTIETAINSGANNLGALRSAVSSEVTARTSADTTLANRSSVLESTVNNNTTGLAATLARVQTEENTRATADTSLANRSTRLEAQQNAAFQTIADAAVGGMDDFTASRVNNVPLPPTYLNAQVVNDTILGAAIQWEPTSGGHNIGNRQPMAVVSGRVYEFRYKFRVSTLPADGGVQFSTWINALDINYANISNSNGAGLGVIGITLTDTVVEVVVVVSDVSTPGVNWVYDANTRYIRCLNRLNSGEAGLVTLLGRIICTDITDKFNLSARILAEELVRTTTDTALATRASNLEATVNTGPNNVGSLRTTITDNATAAATATGAVATRTTALESAVTSGPNNLSALRSTITDNATTSANATTAVGNRTSALETAVTSGPNNLAALRSSVSDEVAARTTADTTLANRASTLESTVNSATDGNTALKSRIASEETTRTTQDAALATRASNLEASVNSGSNSLSALRGSINDNATVAANANTAVANRATALETSVNTGTNNLGALRSAVNSEVTSRTNADTTLANRATALESSVNTGSNSLANLRSTINSNETTRSNADTALANRSTSLETRVSQTPVVFFVHATGSSATNSPFGLDAGIYNSASNRITNGGRSYGVVVFNSSNAVIAANLYDVFAGSSSTAMANFLNGISNGQTVVVYSQDEPQSWRLSNGLQAAMERCGAGPAFSSPNFKYRAAYVLIGRAGIGAGRGKEFYAGATDSDPNAWIDARFELMNGIAQLGEASGAVDLSARISSEETTRTSADSALATRASNLEASVNNGGNSLGNLRAAVNDEATVRTNTDSALAGRSSSLETNYSSVRNDLNQWNQDRSNENVAMVARIVTEETVRAGADSALAGRASALEASVNNGGNSLANLRAAVSDEATARANGDGAIATRTSNLESRAGSVEARVTTTEGAISTLNGKNAAYWGVEVVAGNRARLRAYADNYGSNVDIAADSIYLGNQKTLAVENGRVAIAGDLYMGTGRIVSTNGAYMKVQGTGFGTSNQFLEWFGPNMAIESCSEANASYYLKTNGSAYFGGSLSAGVLKNSVQTTSQAQDANVTTGNFGSNGKARMITVGYSASARTSITGGCPPPYTPYASVRLYRGTNASGTLLAEQQFNGSHGCVAGAGQYEPGNMDDSIGGSLTYTDNTGGSTSSYYAQIVARSVMTTNLIQSLSVTSVEQ